jgi:hypothetical protein
MSTSAAASLRRGKGNRAGTCLKRDVTIEIGGLSVRLHKIEPQFQTVLEDRYAGFVNDSAVPQFHFDVESASPQTRDLDKDVAVTRKNGMWKVERGDFRANWDVQTRRGRVRQPARPYAPYTPYAIDTLLRIVHSIDLAGDGGFLLHAASAIRGNRAFLFTGVSGAGKTTLTRLAPPDVQILTDEISYVRREGTGFRAYGTPFAGELARPGENLSAPVAGVYLLDKGPECRLESVDPSTAVRALLRNILFLTRDSELVHRLFETAMSFISRVQVRRFVFTPDERAWGLIE